MDVDSVVVNTPEIVVEELADLPMQKKANSHEFLPKKQIKTPDVLEKCLSLGKRKRGDNETFENQWEDLLVGNSEINSNPPSYA